MSGISTGIGLISGIDTASLIDQLISIERRPVENLQSRVAAIDVKRAAFIELAAQLLAVQNAISGFGRSSFFRRFNSTSTDGDVLTADPGEKAIPGSHTFRVRSLVTTHSLISRGFTDSDTTPVGAGRMTLESGRAKVNASTELDVLNGGSGVGRGVITITDRSGASADIDLTTALTVNDVLRAINSNTEIEVRASATGVESNGATGDRIVIEDLSGGTELLIIADKENGSTAVDLGIAASVNADRIDGRDLVRLSSSTPLSFLNDGNGVGRFRSGSDLNFSTTLGDFTVALPTILTEHLDTDLRALNSGNGVRLGTIRITDRSGQTAQIDLANAKTVRDVLDAINAADTGVSAIVVGVDDDSVFLLTDESTPAADGENAGKLMVEDVTGFTAADLGIADVTEEGSIYGNGIYRMKTIGDVINAINFAEGNNSLVKASISQDGNGITLRALGFGNTVTITAGTKEERDPITNEVIKVDVSSAAQDLGLLGADGVSGYNSRPLVAGLNTVLLHSLNGGRGIDVGEVKFSDRADRTTTIDFSGAQTLQDVVDIINLDGAVSIRAAVNAAGNGIALYDESGGTGPLTVEDVSGELALDLGLAGTYEADEGDVINGGNLQRQYLSRQTVLSDLNVGRGVAQGIFRITDSTGAVHNIVLSDLARTIGDVIDVINGATPDTIEARINDTGDGIVVIDTSGGSDALTIEDQDGGRSAADLRLAGTADEGEDFIDGSFEILIEIDADDTLETIAGKINNAGADMSATILDYGGSVSPFSLTITSEVSGRRGELLIDTIGVDLGLTTLSQPKDAIITIGDGTGSTPRLISSSSNEIENVVPGVRLNLLSVSDEAVTVSVTQDLDSIVEAIGTFAEKYNDVLDTIDKATSFDPDTYERGPLLGDRTVDVVRNRLFRTVMQRFEGVDESVSRLFSLGLTVGEGNRLQFDEERFRETYEQNPRAVEELFSKEETGLAAVLKDTLERLTEDFDGLITRKDDLLADQQELLNNRIDALNVLLDAKRARLEAQFVALESSLAALQAQQTALSMITPLASQ